MRRQNEWSALFDRDRGVRVFCARCTVGKIHAQLPALLIGERLAGEAALRRRRLPRKNQMAALLANAEYALPATAPYSVENLAQALRQRIDTSPRQITDRALDLAHRIAREECTPRLGQLERHAAP